MPLLLESLKHLLITSLLSFTTLFSVLRNALESASISALENFNMSSGNTGFNIDSQKVLTDLDLTEYTKIKFQEIIVWILHNAVADDPTCQTILLDKHVKLVDICIGLYTCKSKKIKQDLCHLIDNVF